MWNIDFIDYFILMFIRWTRAFSPGEEIWQYLYDFATSYDLHGIIQYNTKVIKADWNEDDHMWTIFTENGKVFKVNIFIGASGALCVPKIPHFKVFNIVN